MMFKHLAMKDIGMGNQRPVWCYKHFEMTSYGNIARYSIKKSLLFEPILSQCQKKLYIDVTYAFL